MPEEYALDGNRRKPTVLIVEDEPAIRAVVAALLEEEGYAVRRARNGLEALAVVDSDPVDLILSDVVMPHLDGASLVRRLRQRGVLVPVVLMSAVYADVDLPGVPFVPKPFDVDRLLEAIATAMIANGHVDQIGAQRAIRAK
jgi:two-component system cell cycle sensor histidine kinase/response regulator CckA